MAWSIRNWFRRSPLDIAARNAYIASVEQARQPAFYDALSVPDSPIGRFDVIALHCFLVLHRLKGEEAAQPFSECYCEILFDDMDRNLREMGVGDLSVGKKIRKMAEGFFGRVSAYERALEAGDAALMAALQRNLYAYESPGQQALERLADYVHRSVAQLAKQDTAALTGGQIDFAPVKTEMGW